MKVWKPPLVSYLEAKHLRHTAPRKEGCLGVGLWTARGIQSQGVSLWGVAVNMVSLHHVGCAALALYLTGVGPGKLVADGEWF